MAGLPASSTRRLDRGSNLVSPQDGQSSGRVGRQEPVRSEHGIGCCARVTIGVAEASRVLRSYPKGAESCRAVSHLPSLSSGIGTGHLRSCGVIVVAFRAGCIRADLRVTDCGKPPCSCWLALGRGRAVCRIPGRNVHLQGAVKFSVEG